MKAVAWAAAILQGLRICYDAPEGQLAISGSGFTMNLHLTRAEEGTA